MQTESFQADVFAVGQLMAEFSYRLDTLGGLTVHELFAADGVYDIDGVTLEGRDAIRDGYRRRSDVGARTSRHLFTNQRFESRDDDGIRGTAVMVLYAANGTPTLPLSPPLVVADVEDLFTLTDEGWRFQRRTLTTIFRGEGETTPPR